MKILQPVMTFTALLRAEGAKPEELDGIAEILASWDDQPINYREVSELAQKAIQQYRIEHNPLFQKKTHNGKART